MIPASLSPDIIIPWLSLQLATLAERERERERERGLYTLRQLERVSNNIKPKLILLPPTYFDSNCLI